MNTYAHTYTYIYIYTFESTSAYPFGPCLGPKTKQFRGRCPQIRFAGFETRSICGTRRNRFCAESGSIWGRICAAGTNLCCRGRFGL